MDAMTPRDPELMAYIVILREALQDLVNVIRVRETAPAFMVKAGIFSLDIKTAHAEGVLRIETGRHAQEELRIEAELVAAGYTLADWCHHALYNTARSPRGGVPTQAEVATVLEDIERLTHESWALDAMLAPATEQFTTTRKDI